MSWLERTDKTAEARRPPPARERELDQAKAEGLPIVQKEAAKGELPFQAVHFQPVKSPGRFEGEFAAKDGDVLFHFWPYGYHQAEREQLAAPRFARDFAMKLREVMGQEFGPTRISVEQEKDMGSYTVVAKGWAAQQFHFELAVKSCEKLHRALGGT